MGKIIALAGVDGCGKTTLANWMREDLGQRGYAPQIVWSRFNNYLSAPFLAATRLSGHNYYTVNEGTRMGFHRFEVLPAPLQMMFVLLQVMDVNMATLFKVNIPSARQKLTICERGPWDTLVDVAADLMSEKLAEKPWPALFLKQIAGKADVILIDRDIELIRSSRRELEYDIKLEYRQQMYRRLADACGWKVLENNRSLDDAQHELKQWLDSKGY